MSKEIPGSVDITCPECNQQLGTKRGFVLHCNKVHKQNSKQILKLYYDTYFKTPDEGICVLTGTPTEYKNFMHGYFPTTKHALQTAKLPTQINYWIFRYNKTEQEAIELVSAEQSKRSNKRKLIPGFNFKINSCKCKEYYTERFNFTEQEAEIIISRIAQESSKVAWSQKQYKNNKPSKLEYYTERYGIELGPIEFESYKEKQLETKKTRNKQFKKLTHTGNISNLEATICNMLYYSGFSNAKMFEKQLVLYDEHENISYSYDFCVKNKIIEINGEYFHGDLYDTNYVMRGGKTADEVRQYDKLKYNFAKSCGYQVLIIKEREFYNNSIEIINNCIKFLKAN